MAIIMSIINQKGGVGKTTTAEALARGLAELHNKKVLCVDMDAQGNISYSLQARETGIANVWDVLREPHKIETALQEVAPNITLIASTPLLANADMELTGNGRQAKLKEALQRVADSYDYIIIDTPPALGILTVNALVASSQCVITSQADIFSMRGISMLYTTITTIKQYINPALQIAGILLTRFNPRTSLSKAVLEQMNLSAQSIGTKLFNTFIRECNAIKEAQATRESIFSYAPKSNASYDYQQFIWEVIPQPEHKLQAKPKLK